MQVPNHAGCCPVAASNDERRGEIGRLQPLPTQRTGACRAMACLATSACLFFFFWPTYNCTAPVGAAGQATDEGREVRRRLWVSEAAAAALHGAQSTYTTHTGTG